MPARISAIAVGRLGQVVTDIFVVHGEKTLFQNVSLGGSVEADVHLCEGSWVVSRGAPAAPAPLPVFARKQVPEARGCHWVDLDNLPLEVGRGRTLEVEIDDVLAIS